MDRIKRLSMQVLDQYKEKFTADFADNKKLLDQLAIVRSKGLKNEMAGYITKLIKREKDTKEEPLQEEIEEIEETVEEEQVEQSVEESNIPQEITIESAEEPAS
ncbi:MAG: hypothetical protein HZC29_02200 [Thaumarchaeota archaeon]|nr:hypothetical protein [Nitrososphaerota archaeon]